MTSPHCSAARALDVAGGEEQLARPGGADHVEELAQARVRVDEPEPRGRHPELARRAEASRRSQDSASSSPPPIAWPLSAATVGNG